MFAEVKLNTYRKINVVPNSFCALCDWLAFRKPVNVLHIDRLLKAYNLKAEYSQKNENIESYKKSLFRMTQFNSKIEKVLNKTKNKNCSWDRGVRMKNLEQKTTDEKS
jgi:hypothetical protein